MRPPVSTKTFVKAIEEASKESDPLLHEMWANLLASQLVEETCHPHFVQILSHFSPAEAKLLDFVATAGRSWRERWRLHRRNGRLVHTLDG